MDKRDIFYAKIGIATLAVLLVVAVLAGLALRARSASANHADPGLARGLADALGMRRYAISFPRREGNPQRLRLVLEHRGKTYFHDTGVRGDGEKKFFLLWGFKEQYLHYSFDHSAGGGGGGSFVNPLYAALDSGKNYVWGLDILPDSDALNLTDGSEVIRVNAYEAATIPQPPGEAHEPPPGEDMVIRIAAVPAPEIPVRHGVPSAIPLN